MRKEEEPVYYTARHLLQALNALDDTENRPAMTETTTNRIESASFLVPIHPHDAVVVAVACDVAEVGVQLPVVKGVGGEAETWGRPPGRGAGLPRNWFSGRTQRCRSSFL